MRRGLTARGFPERLRSLRQERDLTQTELGALVKLHYTHIGRYEKGKARPSRKSLDRLAEVLGVTSEVLLYGEDGPPPP
ncbi:helix-turn-helix domain-containing protein, partial [Planctomycetota bacterium]